MSNTQRILLAIYLPITVLILILDNLYPGVHIVKYIKYTIILTLFFAVISIQKRYREQKILALSYFFIIIADFFFGISRILDNLKINLSLFGIVGFLLAYLCLIYVYQKNFKVDIEEIMAVIPILLIFLYICISLKPYVKGPVLIGTIIFGFILCYMTWSAICTVFRGYFSTKTSILIALSGSLMFICDIGVAFTLFHPYYSKVFVPWLNNIIWAAYIPGWTLLAVIISEENFKGYR